MGEDTPEIDAHFSGTLACDRDDITAREKRLDYLINNTI